MELSFVKQCSILKKKTKTTLEDPFDLTIGEDPVMEGITLEYFPILYTV